MLEVVHVLHELERAGIPYEWAGESEIKVRCPFHSDESPSCHVNVEKRVYQCHAAECHRNGDIIGLMAGFLKTTRGMVWAEMATRYDLKHEKIIDPATVERWHTAIWQAGPLLKELHDRGVIDEDIRMWRLGENEGRVTIPITNEFKLIVNVRKYLPGAPGSEKMKNTRGHSKNRIFPLEQLKFDKICIVGGEMKAIVGLRLLNPHGWGCLTTTGGEGNWEPEFTPKFVGKHVVYLGDIDDAGISAAHTICMHLYRTTSWLGNAVLPLDRDVYSHGDLNDFVAREHGDLLLVVEQALVFIPPARIILSEDEPADVELIDAIHANKVGQRVRLKAMVSAAADAPFGIPKDVAFICDKSQKECAACDLFALADNKVRLHPESPAILEMVSSSRRSEREALMRGLGVPGTCPSVEFEAISHYNVEEARLSPRLEMTNRHTDRMMQPAVCIGDRLEANEAYEMIGRLYPHPSNHQATLLISKYKPIDDTLATFKLDDPDKLNEFRPAEWTVPALEAKLSEIYADLESNVTYIHGRREIHHACDLAYHSPLLLKIDGRLVKGWVETLIMGDSSQGKTETAVNLMKHYDAGEICPVKNASVAGLVGGLQQIAGQYFVVWGVIPTHDRRLVILEELKGASIEVISKLTDMRSSGIAEIPKIERRKTHARTRLIALSNTRSGRDVASYSYGVDAVQELIGGLEDVRRFDAVFVVSNRDVDAAEINKTRAERDTVEHQFMGPLCKSLVMWSWTRTEDQVHFSADVTKSLLTSATDMCKDYDEAIPIVDRGSMRYKLARLSAALACRTFSASDDALTVIVRQCHVDATVGILRAAYDSRASGYHEYSKARAAANNVQDPQGIRNRLINLPFPRDFVEHMLAANSIDPQDVQDWSSWNREEASDLMSYLVRKHALRRSGRLYYKSPPFIDLLKIVLSDGALKDRPEHLPETREF